MPPQHRNKSEEIVSAYLQQQSLHPNEVNPRTFFQGLAMICEELDGDRPQILPSLGMTFLPPSFSAKLASEELRPQLNEFKSFM